MRLILLGLVVAVVGCGAPETPETPEQRLIGTWIYVAADNSVALGATFNADGSYVLQQLELTYSGSINDEVETGTYSATETAVSTVPQKFSCPGPDPGATLAYDFSGSSLQLTGPGGSYVLAPDTAATPSMAAITWGCFQADGSFVAQPLAPVSN